MMIEIKLSANELFELSSALEWELKFMKEHNMEMTLLYEKIEELNQKMNKTLAIALEK